MEEGDYYVISARLTDVETGEIASVSSIKAARNEIEAESEKYIASTFQSPYGITLSPNLSVLYELDGTGNFFNIFSIDAGYRVSKWLSFYLGYASLRNFPVDRNVEMAGIDTPKITVTAQDNNDYETTRYFRFRAEGISIASEADISTASTLPTTFP